MEQLCGFFDIRRNANAAFIAYREVTLRGRVAHFCRLGIEPHGLLIVLFYARARFIAPAEVGNAPQVACCSSKLEQRGLQFKPFLCAFVAFIHFGNNLFDFQLVKAELVQLTATAPRAGFRVAVCFPDAPAGAF